MCGLSFFVQHAEQWENAMSGVGEARCCLHLLIAAFRGRNACWVLDMGKLTVLFISVQLDWLYLGDDLKQWSHLC